MLKGLRVLDFSYLLPGPLATVMLADMGAEVLKVESPVKVDLVRLAPPFIDENCKISYMHAYLNRNKKSLSLDLKKPAALTIIHKLIIEQGFTSVASFASSNEMYWNRLIGRPNASRDLQKSIVNFRDSSAPTCAPMAHTSLSC
jgi:hypothetical protein